MFGNFYDVPNTAPARDHLLPFRWPMTNHSDASQESYLPLLAWVLSLLCHSVTFLLLAIIAQLYEGKANKPSALIRIGLPRISWPFTTT